MKVLLFYFFFFFSGFSWAIDLKSSQQKLDSLLEQVKKHREENNEKLMLLDGKRAILIAESLGDNLTKAKVYVALGNYYYDKNQSSVVAYDYYYKAYRAYSYEKQAEKMAKTLLRLAIVEKNNRNFLKSKESSFLALELLKGQSTDFLDTLYNNLGIVFGELQDLKQAFFYHQKALALRIKNNQQELILQSYNNIATAYLENGKLSKAILFYQKGLSYPRLILEQYPQEYARLLDNYSYLQFLQGQKQVLPNLLKALSIRENCDDKAGVLSSYLHLASYYQKLNQLDLSNSYAYKTYQRAFQTKNYRDVLSALEVLEANSQKLNEYKKALEYAKTQQQILDILTSEELKISEKFADIRYAASQKERENKVLKLQNKEQQLLTEKRKKYLYLAIGIFGVVLLSGIGYFQYSKMEQKQKEQKAASEIIRLLFERQEATEKAKQMEQERIANDLHDSIAGKLSGLMLKLDTISVSSPKEIKSKLDPTVEHLEAILKELQHIVHDMNEQQLISISYPLLIAELANQHLIDKTIITCEIDSTIDWDKISSQVKLVIYYIVQQGVRNINEHSNALQGSVELKLNHPNLLLTIMDNGIGLKKEITLGMGISGMKKRAQEVGGNFEIVSTKNNGTTISIKIPVT